MSEKAKAALFLAIGMGLFLIAGSLVYFFPTSQYVKTETAVTADKTDDSSSVQELYQSLANADSGNTVSLVQEVAQNPPSEIQTIKIEADDRWVLYVTGCVKNPGVYRLPEGARVFQLVEAAGGLTMVADAVAINMAAQLQDGDHVHVPQTGDDDSVRNRNRSSAGTVVFMDGPAVNAPVRAPRQGRKNPQVGNIDINIASDAELQSLPGVGPALSARIIKYREQNGRFKRVSDLINVPGIGGKKLESIEPFVFVR